MISYIGFIAIVAAQAFRIAARVGPMTDYPIIHRLVPLSKTLFPHWTNANYSSILWWLIAIQIAQVNPLTIIVILYFRNTVSDSDYGVYIAPEVVRGDWPKRRGFLGLPLFDDRHSQQNICVYSFCLGLLGGTGLAIASTSHTVRGFGLFLWFLALFHTLEYITTAMYKPGVSLRAFLLDNGREYHIAMIAGVIEFTIEWVWFPSYKTFGVLNYIGLFLVVIGQTMRSVGMITAGNNFSHLIAYHKEDDHQLVTNGIYSILRHPSYTGFYYWSLGLQILMLNPLCFVAFLFVLHQFFADRIEHEEETLIDFFGDAYREYRLRSYVMIPYIVGTKP
eukprot:jgi/Hompol1/1070/HPOL_001174-RA